MSGEQQRDPSQRPARGNRDDRATLFHSVVRGMLPMYLLSLVGERPLYGTEIMNTLAAMSGGEWKPSPGSVYPLLKRLERDGLLHGEWQSGQAAAKRIYSITERGRAELPELQRHLLAELRTVKEIIDQHVEALEHVLAGDSTGYGHPGPSSSDRPGGQ